jgi:hypothetical protein
MADGLGRERARALIATIADLAAVADMAALRKLWQART